MLGSCLFSCFWYFYNKFHFILLWMIDFHIWKFVLFIIKYVLQKFIMLSFFICLKFICRKVGKIKFKSGKSGKSQGIFAPDMAGNPVSRFASFCMNIWSREYSEFLICLAPKIFVFILGPEEKTERFNLEHSWGYCRLQVFAMLFLCFFK